MAKSRNQGRRRWRRIPIVIPIIVIVSVVILYAFFFPPSQGQLALNFSVKISIQLSEHLSNGTNVLHYIVPPGIGIPGGTWRAGTYDSYGVSGNYPIYVPAPTSNNYAGVSLIYVKSTFNRTYTLGDFFSVWGEPLGRNNTLGYTTPPSSSQTGFQSTWFWDMCASPPQGSFHPGLWGNQTLTPNENILLRYSDAGCSG